MRTVLDFIFMDATNDFERMVCLLIFILLLEVIATLCDTLVRGVSK